MGFNLDGFARELVNLPARLVIPVPAGVDFRDAACAPIAFSTVQHMLFDNAKLAPGETILVHAGGSGIGTAAIKMAKALGCTVITTVGDDEKAEKARALGADHVINYRSDRFEHAVRKITNKKGVDVVFEHVGADTFAGSLLSLKRGGRLVTCGATSGPSVTLNLMQLFQQQYRVFGSFGPSIPNTRDTRPKSGAGGACALRQSAVRLKRIGDAVVGRVTVWLLKGLRRIDPDLLGRFFARLLGAVGPWLPGPRVGRRQLAAAFPEKSAAEIEQILS